MANPQIRSFTLTPSTVAPGGTSVGVLDAFDADNRTARVEARIGDASVVTTLVVSDPLPTPTYTEVDEAGNPVATPTLDIVPDPTDPLRVNVTARNV